jgi:hypothetical protein
MHVIRRKLPHAALVIGLTAFTSAGVAARSHAQTGTFGGYTFSLTQSAESWTAAEAEAVADGGHLASITSQAEENFIISAFCNVPENTAVPLWIGATDGNQTHVYHWTDGSPFSYTDYASGEPNDNGGNEDYLTVNWEYARGDGNATLGLWNDTPLNGTTGFGGNTTGPYFGIIETAVPEPSAVVSFVSLLGLSGTFVLRRRRRAIQRAD